MAPKDRSTNTTELILDSGGNNTAARLTFKNNELIIENVKTGERLFTIDAKTKQTSFGTTVILQDGTLLSQNNIFPEEYFAEVTDENIFVSVLNNNGVPNIANLAYGPINSDNLYPLLETAGRFKVYRGTEELTEGAKFYINVGNNTTEYDSNNLVFKIDEDTGYYQAFVKTPIVQTDNIGWENNLEIIQLKATVADTIVAIENIKIQKTPLPDDGEIGPAININPYKNGVIDRKFLFNTEGLPLDENQTITLQIEKKRLDDYFDGQPYTVEFSSIPSLTFGGTDTVKTLALADFVDSDGEYLNSALVKVKVVSSGITLVEDYVNIYKVPQFVTDARSIILTADSQVFLFESTEDAGQNGSNVEISIKTQNLNSLLTAQDIVITRKDNAIVQINDSHISNVGNGVYTFPLYLFSNSFPSVGVTNSATRDSLLPVKIRVAKEGVFDVLTIQKILATDGISGYLTNEVDQIPAFEDGATDNADYATLNGYFKIYEGTTLLDPADVTFSVVSETDMAITIDDATGFYQVSNGSIPQNVSKATAVLRATYADVSIEKTFVVAKSIEGASAKALTLLADSELFVVQYDRLTDTSGVLNPNISLQVSKQNILGDTTFTVSPATVSLTDVNAAAGTATLNYENFSNNNGGPVTITAQLTYAGTTYSDSITIKKSESGIGSNAKAVKLVSDDYQIAYNENGEVPDPTTITLTAAQQGHIGTTFYKFEKTFNGVTQVLQDFAASPNNSSITYNFSTDYSEKFDGPISFKVSTKESLAGNIIATDSISVIGTKDGSNAIEIVVENPDTVFPASSIGEVTTAQYIEGGSFIEAYIGNTKLTPVTSFTNPATPFQFIVQVANSASVSYDTNYLTIDGPNSRFDVNGAGFSNMSADSAYLQLAITVRGITALPADDKVFTRFIGLTKAPKALGAPFLEIPNDNHSFLTSEDGTVNYGGSGTTVRLLIGDTELTPVAQNTATLNPGEFKVTRVLGSGNINIATYSINGKQIIIPDYTSFTTNAATVTLTAEYKEPQVIGATAPTTKDITRTLTYTKALSGTKGRSVVLTGDVYQITHDGNGENPSPTQIELTASSFGNVFPITYKFYAGTTLLNQTPQAGNTYLITDSNYVPGPGNSQDFSVEVIEGGTVVSTDSISVFGTKEGSGAVTLFVPNNNHTFTCDQYGDVVSNGYAGSGTSIRVAIGNDLLTASTANTDGDLNPGEFRATVTETIVGRPTTPITKPSANTLQLKDADSFPNTSDTAVETIEIKYKRINSNDVEVATVDLAYSKSKEGKSALSALLSNESHTEPRPEAGNTFDLSDAGGNVQVFYGGVNVTNTTSYSIPGESPNGGIYTKTSGGLKFSLTASNGLYSLSEDTSWTSDKEQFTVRAIYTPQGMSPIAVNKIYSITKSKSSRAVYLTCDRIAFTKDGNGDYSPATQTANFIATKQDINSNVSWSVHKSTDGNIFGNPLSPLNTYLTVNGDTATMSKNQFVSALANDGVEIKVKAYYDDTQNSETLFDQITLISTKDGASPLNVILSNESHTEPQVATGSAFDLSDAGGIVQAYFNGVSVPASNLVFSGSGWTSGSTTLYKTQGGLKFTLTRSSGQYTLSEDSTWTSDGEPFVFDVKYKPGSAAEISVTKTYSIAKSKNSTSIYLTSDKQSFTLDGNGDYSPSTQTVTFTALRENIELPVTWSVYGTTNGTSWTEVQDPVNTTQYLTRSASPFTSATLTQANFSSILGSTYVAAKIKAQAADVFDEVTLIKTKDGQGAVSFFVPNTNHSFTCNTDGTPITFAGSGTKIKVKIGDEYLTRTTSGTTNAGEFRATVTETAVGRPDTPIIVDSGDADALFLKDADSFGSDNATETLTIYYKRFNSTTEESATIDLTYSKSKTGSTGINAKTVKLESDDYQIAYESDGKSPAPTTITLTATQQNHVDTVYYDFLLDGTSQQNTTGSTFSYSLPDTKFDTPKAFSLKTRERSSTGTVIATDSISIVATKDGDSSPTISIPNDNHTFTADTDGTVASGELTAGGTDIEVYIGNDKLAPVDTITDKNQFSVSLANTGIVGSLGPRDPTNKKIPLSITNFPAANDSGTITLTINVRGNTTDTTTYTRVLSYSKSKKGDSAINGFLTNESHTVPASSDGTYNTANLVGGTFKVFYGGQDVTTSATFSVQGEATKNSLTIAIVAGTGVYSLSGGSWTSDSETFTLRATYGGANVDRIYSITKSKGGSNGASAKTLVLSADSQTFTKDGNGAFSPTSQTITFSAKKQNITDNTTWSVYRGYPGSWSEVTNTDSAYLTVTNDTATMTQAQFNSLIANEPAVKVTAVATGAPADDVTIIAVQDGARGNDDTIYNFSRTGVDANGVTRVSGWSHLGSDFNSLLIGNDQVDFRPFPTPDSIDGGNVLGIKHQDYFPTQLTSDFIPVDTSLVYKFETRFRQEAVSTTYYFYCGLQFYNANKTLLSSKSYFVKIININVDNNWRSSSTTFTGTATVNSNVIKNLGGDYENQPFPTTTKYVKLVINVQPAANLTEQVTHQIDYIWFYENKANLGTNNTLPVSELTEDSNTFYFTNTGKLKIGLASKNLVAPATDGFELDPDSDIEITTKPSQAEPYEIPDISLTNANQSLTLLNSTGGQYGAALRFKTMDGRYDQLGTTNLADTDTYGISERARIQFRSYSTLTNGAALSAGTTIKAGGSHIDFYTAPVYDVGTVSTTGVYPEFAISNTPSTPKLRAKIDQKGRFLLGYTTSEFSSLSKESGGSDHLLNVSGSAQFEGSIITNGNIFINEDSLIQAGTVPYRTQERGTFDPVIAGTSKDGSPTYNGRYGKYIKTGDLVWVSIYIDVTGWSSLSAPSGNLKVTGLPFSSSQTTGYKALFSLQFSLATWALSAENVYAVLGANDNVIYGGYNNVESIPIDANFKGKLYITGTYTTL